MSGNNYNSKFSIITVSFNSVLTIRSTIESVISQNYDNIEYIVVDGNSTDGTIDIIAEYSNKISKTIVENDSGIYEAMNKGIREASGEYILMLNADDRLFTEYTVSQFVDYPVKDHDAEVYLGRVLLYNKKDGSGTLWSSKRLTPSSVFRGSVPHPATIYTRRAFDINGLFNEDFKLAGDYEWIVRAVARNKLSFSNIDLITSIFFKGGASTQAEQSEILNEEIERTKYMHFSGLEILKYRVRTRLKKIFGI